MYKTYCPFLHSDSLHKNGQDFLDIQYNEKTMPWVGAAFGYVHSAGATIQQETGQKKISLGAHYVPS